MPLSYVGGKRGVIHSRHPIPSPTLTRGRRLVNPLMIAQYVVQLALHLFLRTSCFDKERQVMVLNERSNAIRLSVLSHRTCVAVRAKPIHIPQTNT
jgi:hypothetical protein